MKQTLDKLRSKSDKEKRKVAFKTTFSLTAIIFIFWVIGFYYQVNVEEDSKRAAKDISPFANIIDVISGLFKDRPDFEELDEDLFSDSSEESAGSFMTENQNADFETENSLYDTQE